MEGNSHVFRVYMSNSIKVSENPVLNRVFATPMDASRQPGELSDVIKSNMYTRNLKGSRTPMRMGIGPSHLSSDSNGLPTVVQSQMKLMKKNKYSCIPRITLPLVKSTSPGPGAYDIKSCMSNHGLKFGGTVRRVAPLAPGPGPGKYNTQSSLMDLSHAMRIKSKYRMSYKP